MDVNELIELIDNKDVWLYYLLFFLLLDYFFDLSVTIFLSCVNWFFNIKFKFCILIIC